MDKLRSEKQKPNHRDHGGRAGEAHQPSGWLSFLLDSTTWTATESLTELSATTQIYSWAFVGPTDFTRGITFSLISPPIGPIDFLPTSDTFFGLNTSNILGNGLLDDGTIADALGTLTGFESPHERCSVTDFPPCEPGVINVWSATVDWGEFDNPGIAGATGHSITLLESHAALVPEPSTLLLLGTGPFRIDTSERVSDSSE